MGLAIMPAALAQKPGAESSRPSTHTESEPFHVESFGTYGWMTLRGDFSSVVTLGAVLAKHPSTGIGTLSGARGEITLFDGKPFLSYGRPGDHPAADKETAALLVTATVASWQSVPVDRDVAPGEVGPFLAAAARAHGIDPAKSFPFELTGTLTNYVMHVNAAPIAGPHGKGMPVAITVASKGEELPGKVAGVYVATNLVGIVTHGDTHLHAHWLGADGRWTADLDQWGIKRGATLSLPKAP